MNAAKNLGMSVAEAVRDAVEAAGSALEALHRNPTLLQLQIAALTRLLHWRQDVFERALKVRNF